MKTIAKVFTKYVVSYAAVLFAIMLLPAFLIVEDISIFDKVINYLFNNNS